MDLYGDMSDITESISNDYNGGTELSYGNLYHVLEQINQTQHKNKLNFYNSLIQNLYPKYPFLSMPIPTKNKQT